ncbi:MAG TPA: DNA mismatch repair endonuclease MutL, partial [Bacteroidales bacterium]|nr:DNA mismatch repair endonuclease MutL [Bacteroidales bacterium]
MPDIIQLLPDNVANQIAAGEVIQRPASVVKELLENAVDAGADNIQLVIKDSGKTLIQVVDNGSGMSDTDARLSVERHATSKIRKADDLFAIHTMGFRGEAMASVAAIAHLEIKTKRQEDETGTRLYIEGSEVKTQEPDACNNGTTISVKNLFYNVPARRNFLKSDNAEFRHVLEEFQRIALVYPNIRFSLTHNKSIVYKLDETTPKKRIVDVFGSSLNKKLVPVQSATSMAKITGFIGKPEFARKKRGEQYFFVNNRFIKHPYFNHAVTKGYQELLPEGYYPAYFIFFEVPSERVDVNIHPTKTEVNFQDGMALYSVISSMIKEAIGKFNLSPSIDFDTEETMDLKPPKDPSNIPAPGIHVDPEYNPFNNNKGTQKQIDDFRQQRNRENWTQLYKLTTRQGHQETAPENTSTQTKIASDFGTDKAGGEMLLQVSGKYIASSVKSGLMMVDQTAAHERILYERILKRLEKRSQGSQQQLFPQNVTFAADDAAIIKEMLEELRYAGFDIEPLGKNTFVVNGLPNDLNEKEDVESFLDSMLESYKHNEQSLETDRSVNLALSMATNM